MKDSRPVIVGYDLVSPLGTDPEGAFAKALAGESGIGALTRFPLRPNFPVSIAGQVEEIDPSPYPFLAPRKLAMWPLPLYKYSMLVVHRALAGCGISITRDLAPETAVTMSAAIGGLNAVVESDRVMVGEGKWPKPWVNPNACVNMVAGKIAILTGATGPNLSTITACATGATSMVIGAMLIASGQARLVICGGVDFPLIEPIVAGFGTMNGAFRHDYEAAEQAPPSKASQPFSAGRRGFVISEGAGAIILAGRDFARTHGLEIKAELAGWCMNGDANHFVAPYLPTVSRCMADAIRHAGIKPDNIQAINAHAASTKVGDQVEAQALHAVFGSRIPPVTANKSLIGHTMGAASAIEVIMAIQGMAEGVLPPTINLDPDPELKLDCLSDSPVEAEQEHVLKNAFGFGGSNCCLVLKRV